MGHNGEKKSAVSSQPSVYPKAGSESIFSSIGNCIGRGTRDMILLYTSHLPFPNTAASPDPTTP